MKKNIYRGLITALITPFHNNEIDFGSLKKLLANQISNNIESIIVCGSTGESVLLSLPEILAVAEYSKKIAGSNANIIGGISMASLESAIILAQEYEKIGLDGIMCASPYYIKPTQSDLYNFFKEVADKVNLPIMLYNIPSRAGTDLQNGTILDLTKIDNIVALKDASGDLTRPLELSTSNPHVSLLSGDDVTCLGFIAQGGHGCVSVASNIVPQISKQINDYALAGNFTDALKLHKTLTTLYQVLFIETNPIPVKYALSEMGLCHNNLRKPLSPISEQNAESIRMEMKKLGLI